MSNDFHWYTVQSNGIGPLKLKEQILNVLENYNLTEYVEDFLIATEEIIEVKKGVQKITERNLYPGYIFIKAKLTKEVISLIQSLPKVSCIITNAGKPTQLTETDLRNIQNKIANKAPATPKYNFEVGDEVLILEGSFANFKGTVDEYDLNSGMLKLSVFIFGRNTPVDIHFSNVEIISE